MDGLSMRRAAEADAASVAEVYLRSRAAAGNAIPPGVHSDDDVRRFVAEVVVPQREAWIAQGPDGSCVGVMVLVGDDLDWLWVLPDAQGHGVGTALVDLANHRRPGGLALWVFETNVAARRFYERHGWVAVRRTSGDNEEGAPDVRYVRGRHWGSDALTRLT